MNSSEFPIIPMSPEHSKLGTFTLLKTNSDSRGSLQELWRADTLDPQIPLMSYISWTNPGVVRGPHEHVHQTDFFSFTEGKVLLELWSKDAQQHEAFILGDGAPYTVCVPPGVVHAYTNLGDTPVRIINSPDKLFAGWNRSEPVDEIRHEQNPHNIYKPTSEHDKKILIIVTGAQGFIGREVVRQCLKRGDCYVVGIDQQEHGLQTLVPDLEYRKARIESDTVFAFCTKYRDVQNVYLINCAAETHNDRCYDQAAKFTASNVQGPANLFNLFWNVFPGAKRMLQVSTDEVYGPTTTPAEEGGTLNPTSVYAITKAAGEAVLMSLADHHPERSLVITRGPNTFGPYQHPEKLMPMVLTRTLMGVDFPLYNPDTAKRSWLSVEEHAKYIVHVLFHGQSKTVYNLPSLCVLPNHEAIHTLATALSFHDHELRLRPTPVDGKVRAHHDLCYVMNSDLFKESFPEMKFERNPADLFWKRIESTVKWYVENVSWWMPIVKSVEFREYMVQKYPTLTKLP